MARRRGQRRGWLRADSGSWLLTYRKYVWDPELRKTIARRVTENIGPAPDPPTRRCKNGELTETQAERFAWDHYLSKVDNSVVKPLSTQTLNLFWEQRYKIHIERKRKYATQSQYASLWKVWIKPFIGDVRLFELTPDLVDRVISHALAAKKGSATVKHIRKVISAMIEHARMLQMFSGENPAQLVELPDQIPVRRARSLDMEQCREWLAASTDEPADPKDKRSRIKPLRTMSLLGICCALGVSEQLGLTWGNLNLTDTAVTVDGESIEANSAAIRIHSYHGRVGTLKNGHRRRNVPLPKILVELLLKIRSDSAWTGQDDPIFANQQGKAIWADSLVKRVMKPKATALDMPWLSPHLFRHTCATLTKTLGMMDVDRRTLMGHADEIMTDRYTHEDFERMRTGIEQLATEITKAPKKAPALAANVVVMPKRRKAKSSDSQSTAETVQVPELKDVVC